MAETVEENVLAQWVAQQSQDKGGIDNGVKIDGASYQLERRDFSLGFSIVVPSNFEPLAVEYARKKYPYENRPRTIISSGDTTVNFAFDSCGAGKGVFEERLLQYQWVIKRLHPSNVFYLRYLAQTEAGGALGCYDFRSYGLDGDIYNFSFFTDLPNCELLGWFTCPAVSQSKWEPLVRKLVKTIQPTKNN